MADPEISVVKMPSFVSLAMDVAPLVRLNVITDEEGRDLVNLRYYGFIAAPDPPREDPA